MDIQLPTARQDIVLQVEASPFVVDDLVPVQNVFIYLGGLFVTFFALKGHMTSTFPVNRAAITGRGARMSLVIPTATSPKSLFMSEDLRALGIYLTSITFKTA